MLAEMAAAIGRGAEAAGVAANLTALTAAYNRVYYSGRSQNSCR